MPSRSSVRPPAVPLAVVLSTALLALAGGCRDSGKPAPGSDARRYTVRGEVVGISTAAGGRQLSLRHEPIPDFADQSGKVVGMRSMVMPFDLAPGAGAEDLRPGDKVEARISVGWSPPTMRVEELRKLPADTTLRFGDARPPGG